MATDFKVPSALGIARHWVAHKNKQPFGKIGAKGWDEAHYWYTLDEAKKVLEAGGYDGLGFIVARESSRKEKQILGGDLDCCRDPQTGEGSAWALRFLKKINSWAEPSFTGTGYRFACYGKLPAGPDGKDLNLVVGSGDDDLTDEMKAHIIAAKPKVAEKLAKYGPSETWNTFELYEDGPKHLTITGQGLEEYPAELQHRQEEVLEIISPYLDNLPESVTTTNSKGKGNRFPSLGVLDVIDTTGFTRSGPELVGANPILGSIHGTNLKVNPSKNSWTNFHNDARKGGDAWVWLACECGAIDWEQAGKGVFKDPEVVRKTLEHALQRGLITEDEARSGPKVESSEPTIRKVSLDDQSGTVGVAEDGTIKRVVGLSKDDPSKKELHWISDCACFVDTETSAGDVTEFTFVGTGAKDHRKVKFTLQAVDLEPRKFKTHLINHFGAKNQVGKLDFETVQRLTRNTRVIRRIETPVWVGKVPMVPGIGEDLAKNIEFKLSPMTPARVYDGDLPAAKDQLRKALKVHPNAPILIATIMGAVAIARWRPDDRFALALWGLTGAIKTTFAQVCMAVYGLDYTLDKFLLKHGKAGSTVNAAMHIMARAGILCQILDNVKSIDPKDFDRYVSIVQATIEGSDKQRGRKDGGTVEALTFLCTPIITGETRPEEAATDARVLNLDWPKLTNTELLTEVQNKLELMPVVGYYWLRFLAETKLDIDFGFAETRNKYEQKFAKGGYVNPGRLATIYTTLRATWRLLCESPFGDVFKEAEPAFLASLDTAIQVQGAIVNADTEVSKFLTGVNELLAGQPGLFQASDGTTLFDRIIGKHTDEGLFLLPNETLSELDKLKVFTQKPTVDSMSKALDDAGKLIRDKDGEHRLIARRVSGKLVRGWLLLPTAFTTVTTGVVTENQHQETPVTSVTTVTTEKAKCNFKENLDGNSNDNNASDEYGGNTGNNGNNIVIDSDLGVTKLLPPLPPKGAGDTWQNRKLTCIICGEVSKFDLYIAYKNGYCCYRCHSEHRTIDDHKEKAAGEQDSAIQTELKRANEQDKQREAHFMTPAAKKTVRWTEDQPKPAPAPTQEESSA